MTLGKTIKKLRRKRNMTQEQLANLLSLSPQAISRWETDMAMPDLSLIAPLCHLFHVTSDELLGIDLSRREEEVTAICREAQKYSSRGYLEKARDILEEGLQRYPDHCDLMYHLMHVSFYQKNASGDRRYLDETITWGEKLLGQSTEEHKRHSAIQILCYSYRDAGRAEEAEKMAETMPTMAISREMLLSNLYTGSKDYDAKQCNIAQLLQFLSNGLFFLQTELDSGEMAYTQEENAVLREKRIALLHLFFENGDFGFYHSHLCDTHRDQAFYYAQKGEEKKALQHLSFAAEHAIKFITSVNEVNTSLVFRGSARGSWSTSSATNEAAHLLQQMERSGFDALRQTEDFIRIKESLSAYAGNWDID